MTTRLYLCLIAACLLVGCSSNTPTPQPQSAKVSSVSRTLASPPASQSVTLTWNLVPNAAGYNLYWGTTSGNYISIVSVGNVTNATVTGLITGGTYYFAATTLAKSGLESGYSVEVSLTLPNCINCPDIETNFVYDYGRQLCVQTDLVYWPVFVKWTNSLPGYPTAFFRLISTSNNLWQAQVSHDLRSWNNMFGTVLSSRKPRLLLTNWVADCVATNITTNWPTGATQSKPPTPSGVTS